MTVHVANVLLQKIPSYLLACPTTVSLIKVEFGSMEHHSVWFSSWKSSDFRLGVTKYGIIWPSHVKQSE